MVMVMVAGGFAQRRAKGARAAPALVMVVVVVIGGLTQRRAEGARAAPAFVTGCWRLPGLQVRRARAAQLALAFRLMVCKKSESSA
jgi:hypothetical protein